jgi:hypothetical protein
MVAQIEIVNTLFLFILNELNIKQLFENIEEYIFNKNLIKLFDYKEFSHYPRMIQYILFFHIVTILKKFIKK